MWGFSWGLFLLLAVGAIFVALGVPIGPVVALGAVIGLFVAFRYPYFTFYSALFLMPFLGLTLSIPTGELAFGKRAFGGSIDISVAEAVFLFVLAGWALKILLLWIKRRDQNWKPRLPLLRSYATLTAAHLASALSPLDPDRVLVTKFVIRPVLFCYLIFIAAPVNFLRSRRRLVAALGVLSASGIFAALNGVVSLFFVDASSQFIRRAHPLPLFGVPLLGDNHNLLAELMVVTVMGTLALSLLVKSERARRLFFASAVFQGLIGLLTFSRTGWIVFILQAAFLGALEYRTVLRRKLSLIVGSFLILIPLGFVMTSIASSSVATSSNSSRFALSEIAWEVFLTSPWIGSGAGTFIERVGSAQVFWIEYGTPLDSHGFLQKLGAETGVFGLLGLALVLLAYARASREGLTRLPEGPVRRAAFLLVAAALGAVAYQLFNTNYWTGKMWLPIGLSLASFRALLPEAGSDESERVLTDPVL